MVWAWGMSDEDIEQGRRRDKVRKKRYYGQLNAQQVSDQAQRLESPLSSPCIQQSGWQGLLAWWKNMLSR